MQRKEQHKKYIADLQTTPLDSLGRMKGIDHGVYAWSLACTPD